MGFQALVRNTTKLVLMGLGGVLGAAVMVWARANSEWITIRVPAVMVPGSSEPLEYEAQLWGIVALSFAGGVLSCLWLALAVWLRSIQRERRLARVLEQVEEQIRTSRENFIDDGDSPLSLPTGEGNWEDRSSLMDFDEIDAEDRDSLNSDSKLPEGYDDDEDHVVDEEDRDQMNLSESQSFEENVSGRNS